MVILRGQNNITVFLMILAWACPFKIELYFSTLRVKLNINIQLQIEKILFALRLQRGDRL